MKKYFIVLIFIFQGCDLLENKPDQVIARLNDEFLYNSDLVEKLPKNISKDDSILFAKNFIDNWAKNKLLYNQALINLDRVDNWLWASIVATINFLVFIKQVSDIHYESPLSLNFGPPVFFHSDFGEYSPLFWT